MPIVKSEFGAVENSPCFMSEVKEVYRFIPFNTFVFTDNLDKNTIDEILQLNHFVQREDNSWITL